MKDHSSTAMGDETQVVVNKHKGPINLGLFGGILLLPFLFLAAALSIPYALVASRIRDHKEKQLRIKLKEGGRTIEWHQFLRELSAGRGTLFIDMCWPKGPERWWWTEDDVRTLSPYPLPDTPEILIDIYSEFDPVRNWCTELYTSPTTGKASLVVGANKEKQPVKQELNSMRIITLYRTKMRVSANSIKKA